MSTYETVKDLDARAIRELCVAIVSGDSSGVRAHGRERCLVQWDGRREFYSYGRHFPLARYVPRDGRTRPLWVINGDVWRGSRGWHSRTADHQTATRETIAGAGIPSLILPFSAVLGAGIELETVRPIHVRDDANWTEFDALPDDLDLDSLETAHAREPFDNGERSSAGVTYIWRGADRREYKRAFYSRAWIYTGEIGAGGYPAGEWRDVDAAEFAADPAGAATSEHAYLNRNFPLERTADGWHVRRDMHRLGDSLFSACRRDPATGELERRAVYLSSFDVNENPPLYFLAAIPRGSGATKVETALEALAPRAVHAALARGLDVRRQGDIFLIPTRQTRETLAEDGATFARLTQWTRDAAPRAGEINYLAPLPIAERRRLAELERRAIVREWRATFRGAAARATAGYAGRHVETETDRAARRAETARTFADLLERHAAECAAVDATGTDRTAPESLPCQTCRAPIGAACRPIGAGADLPESLADRLELERRETGAHVARVSYENRDGIAGRHARELDALRQESRTAAARARATSARPETARGARRKHAAECVRADAAVDAAREYLRRAVFADASTLPRYRHAGPAYGETAATHRRRVRVSNAKECRANLERALAARDAARHVRGTERDSYRRLFGTNAAGALVSARATMRERYRPETVDSADAFRRRRERIRGAVAIFGTAHAAAETARTSDGRTYARGTVRHVIDLEPGRVGTPDHRPLDLAENVWYLAVRNTVPRQRRRRARRASVDGR